MGTDIHLHTEVKVNGVWHHYNAPWIRRSYALFSLMADVRNLPEDDDRHVPPISPPKGLPEDLSVITQLDYDRWGVDAHTESWFGSKEIQILEEWMRSNSDKCVWEFDNWGFLFGNGWGEFHGWNPEEDGDYSPYPHEIEDIRFVFWFDC